MLLLCVLFLVLHLFSFNCCCCLSVVMLLCYYVLICCCCRCRCCCCHGAVLRKKQRRREKGGWVGGWVGGEGPPPQNKTQLNISSRDVRTTFMLVFVISVIFCLVLLLLFLFLCFPCCCCYCYCRRMSCLSKIYFSSALGLSLSIILSCSNMLLVVFLCYVANIIRANKSKYHPHDPYPKSA